MRPLLATTFLQYRSFLDVMYIIAFSLFIQGLRGLSGPTTAVRGNRIAAVGMGIALVATFLIEGMGNWGLIAFGLVVGTINVVGGFLVTDRMLEMFKSKPAPPKEIEE